MFSPKSSIFSRYVQRMHTYLSLWRAIRQDPAPVPGDAVTDITSLHSHKQGAHLVALHPPDLENPRHCLQQLKLVLPEEDGTAVWPIIALYIQTRRIGLREKHAVVTQRGQDGFEEVEMIHLLKNPVCDVSLHSPYWFQHPFRRWRFNCLSSYEFIYSLLIDADIFLVHFTTLTW